MLDDDMPDRAETGYVNRLVGEWMVDTHSPDQFVGQQLEILDLRVINRRCPDGHVDRAVHEAG